ncbi:hypothetical protein H5410_039885 [Solanum commersonii]|uniref:Uncharacterized protein n=1 Tax=Solanum commersonii TaxID=4109 RepID=A0A9J5XM93_SOLCO|nr:hypothetical protein H5410_039885 [Solanum commersonii]
MKNVTDSFVSLGHWPSAGSFGFNTDILATNPINLSVVLGVLIFWKGSVCEVVYFKNRLDQPTVPFSVISRKRDNRKEDLEYYSKFEELRGRAIEQLRKSSLVYEK